MDQQRLDLWRQIEQHLRTALHEIAAYLSDSERQLLRSFSITTNSAWHGTR
jgi:hypothetical protein